MAISKKIYKGIFFFLFLTVVLLYFYKYNTQENNYKLVKNQFSDLPDWNSKNILPSLKSFEQSCRIIRNKEAMDSAKLSNINVKIESYKNFCKLLPDIKNSDDLKILIENNFYPVYLRDDNTLFTGYIEIEIKGRITPSIHEAPNAVPIFMKPPNIISVNLEKFGNEYRDKKILGMIRDNDFVPVPSRKTIENQNMFQEYILAYIDDPALAYFLHIQGSGLITLPSGETMAVSYAGDNGKDYYSIGKKLIEDEIIKKENMSMQSILAWMRDNEEAAFKLMQKNERFIFFKERNNLEPPNGSSGTIVTPMHSAAIDNRFIPYHLPLWVEVDDFYNNSTNKRLTNIFLAQDTGSAINGITRMDLFLGKGKEAEEIAGKLSSRGKIWLFIPK